MNFRLTTLYTVTFILAFCSIGYELILAQSLTVLMSNTVLRYSVTIGLYMFALGIGAYLAEGKIAKNAIINLLKLEILLTLLGGFSVVILFTLLHFLHSGILFILSAHLLIIAIGVLSGFEIPLLLELAGQEEGNANSVLASNYAGAFLGTISFAFFFFSHMGLMATAFTLGTINALVSLSLICWESRIGENRKKTYYIALYSQTACFFLIALSLLFARNINQFFINLYLGV